MTRDPRYYYGPLPAGVDQVVDQLGHEWTETYEGLFDCPERGAYSVSFTDVCREYLVPLDSNPWLIRPGAAS